MLDTIIHWALIAYLIIAPTVAVFLFRKPGLPFALIVAGATALLFTRLPEKEHGLGFCTLTKGGTRALRDLDRRGHDRLIGREASEAARRHPRPSKR